MQKRKPVLTLLRSDDSFDFSSVIGHKKEINEQIEKALQENEKRQAKALLKLREDNIRIGMFDKMPYSEQNIIVTSCDCGNTNHKVKLLKLNDNI